MPQKIQVNNTTEPPVPAEVMAQAIVDMSAAVKRLNATRLNRRAVIALIHDKSGLGKTQITTILNCLDQLEADWLKPKAKPAARRS